MDNSADAPAASVQETASGQPPTESVDAPAAADANGAANSGKRKHTDTRNSRGGRGAKKRDLGRNEWKREYKDKRERNDITQDKRRKLGTDGKYSSIIGQTFTEEEIAAEERKPKRKVAVMIGYSGSGYRGMQINTTEKTIEGDLFNAFVAAGAISKANATDPKKSSLVRCARTDKGVHAAGNVISLKLIIEEPDIVQKINEHLSPQIRVWGIERTTGSFNCYQACDSRWYEYFIPTHCFLPPHPKSFLGRKLAELAEEADDVEGYTQRQEEVAGFWDAAEEKYIKPLLDEMDEETRKLVEIALYSEEAEGEPEGQRTPSSPASADRRPGSAPQDGSANVNEGTVKPSAAANTVNADTILIKSEEPTTKATEQQSTETSAEQPPAARPLRERDPIQAAVKKLRAAYIAAKKDYRIDQRRLERVQNAFEQYVGTRNFHNYTIKKGFKNPSAKRHIKSFVVNKKPFIIGGTEWLSLKVHGQSFMMHQIRKMVGMAALVVRCGCAPERIQETYQPDKLSIPKAPGLGLLLERPVFDTYNTRTAPQNEREPIDFDKYKEEMDTFKQSEIYERIYREEDQMNAFHVFFAHIDNYNGNIFLYLSSKGIEATKGGVGAGKGADALFGEESGDEDNAGGNEG